MVAPTVKMAKLNDNRYELSLEDDRGLIKCFVLRSFLVLNCLVVRPRGSPKESNSLRDFQRDIGDAWSWLNPARQNVGQGLQFIHRCPWGCGYRPRP
jgi:hypothetical protein